MNYRTLIPALRDNRDRWLEKLNEDPDNVEAAQFIVQINAQIRMLETNRRLDGDWEPID